MRTDFQVREESGHNTCSPNLAEIRAKLAGSHGQRYWQSLEEIAETPQFKEMLEREFPAGASEWWDGLSRRNFLKMAAASMALAGLSACTKQPPHEILPYIKQPEELVLGEPLFYATSMVHGGFANGVLAKSREGHPIKVDGNPEHPATLGSSDIWMQASILGLYDPDRSQTVNRNGEISTWDLFVSELNELVSELRSSHGKGLRFLTETITSPSLGAQLQNLLQRYPQAKWHEFEPLSRDNIKEGAKMAFGEMLETQYRFEQAAVVVSFEADFLYSHPAHLSHTRQFANGRRVSAGKTQLNRLYLVESTPSITGSMAEYRLALSSGEVESVARSIAQQLGALPSSSEPKEALRPEAVEWVVKVVKDLKECRGKSIIIAGECQPPAVHALTHLINDALGNVGKTVSYTDSAEVRPINQIQSFKELVAEMKSGAVDTLFILGGNPAFTSPADLEFGESLSKVRRSIHLGVELDETAALCSWHIPQAHYLESWGDARAFDGTVSLLQPLIAPLYGGKTASEVLDAMDHQQPLRNGYEILQDFWNSQNRWADFDKGWRQSLHDGYIGGTQSRAKAIRLKEGLNRQLVSSSSSNLQQISAQNGTNPLRSPAPPSPFKAPAAQGTVSAQEQPDVEICFRADPNVWDGRFANNGWLQECPRPVSKLTWDNALMVSPSLAERLGVHNNDVLQLDSEGHTLRAAVWIMPGQAANSLTLHLGYGRTRVGRVGAQVGFNSYSLRSTSRLWSGRGISLSKTGERHLLVATQTHHNLQDPERQIYRSGTLQEFLQHPDFVKKSVEQPENAETLYRTDEYTYPGYKWAMSIDLSACIGCNACIVACEAENNIPVVGKDQVNRNREMLWLRVDTYYQGSLDNPRFHHMPVACMQCEHAPCELVCPVEATVHDQEGLNLQVYNRCVGTRFCSNNCPYKVRRFNFLQYTTYKQPSYKPMYNPEVTVRWRGVMEKCTYCIQRIARARINGEKENRRIPDGGVITACQQACPAEAIVFGDLNNPDSKVARLKNHPLDYSMLGELNTRPRTTYLAKVQDYGNSPGI